MLDRQFSLAELLPHRQPMLLLDQALEVTERSSTAIAIMHQNSPFHLTDLGVPAWVGLEFMGQTAALIAGFQTKQGVLNAHTGFLLGSRNYQARVAWFESGTSVQISCNQIAVVGTSLANFDCQVCATDPQGRLMDQLPLATAVLSVFRQSAEALPHLTTGPNL